MNMEELIHSLYWGQIYSSTIIGSKWLVNQSISPGRWAVGYEFLYVLYRILNDANPNSILELGLGQSTKLTGQYAAAQKIPHIVVEHDSDWVDFFCKTFDEFSENTTLQLLPLITLQEGPETCLAYNGFSKVFNNVSFQCILVDGPFGGDGTLSRRDILFCLPDILSETFVMMFHDCGRPGEQRLVQDVLQALQKANIQNHAGIYDGGGISKTVVITCPKWKWLTSL